MSEQSIDAGHQPNATSPDPCAVVWLGAHTPLLDRAWQVAAVVHVQDARSLMRMLQYRFASCVVLDLAFEAVDYGVLVPYVRQHWPTVGLLGVLPTPDLPEPAELPYQDIDVYVGRQEAAGDLDGVIQRLSHRVSERMQSAPPPSTREYRDLQQRVRHLEGLAQATFSMTGAVSERSILGDLPNVARVAVDADDIAVLLTDDDFYDLSDALNLGVSEAYLDVCREHFHTLPYEERPTYVGDEVLLRERVPGMLLSAPRIREAEAAQAWSYMRLPLTIDQRLVGFVALFSSSPGQFHGPHLQLGRLFAAQVAAAVRNVRLYLRLNRAERQQRAVSEVARVIAEGLTLDAVLTRIVEEAVRLVDGEIGTVLLTEPDGSLVVRATYGGGPDQSGRRVMPGVGQAGRIALTGQPSIVYDYQQWEGANNELRDWFPPDGVLIGVPLIYQGRVLGILQVITTQPQQHSIQEDKDVLMVLAPQAATAIAKAQLHEIVRQDRQQLQTILDHTAAAVMVCDAEGRVLVANPQTRRVLYRLGLNFEQVYNRRVQDLLHEMMPDEDIELDELGHTVELNLGDAGEYLVHVSPIADSEGHIERYVGVGQDVSELRRLDRLKSDMIHILSHDLRNPLGLARGSIDLLDEPDVPADQRAQLKGMIINSLDRMDRLINDVVDLEMAGSLGEDTAIPYRLDKVIGQVVKSNRDDAEHKDIELAYAELAIPAFHMQGHAVLIGQAVENLVSNAIKYTPSGGHIAVTLTVEDEDAVIRVQDDGYGVPPEDIPHLFQQFYRVKDKRTRHIQGTGLGLSLVKAIATAHGGSVTVESELDKGSTFTLYLPLTQRVPNHNGTTHIRTLDLSALVIRPEPPARPV